jgi:hypothetical protein
MDKELINKNNEEDFSLWNIHSVFLHIKDNIIPFSLLLLVPIIIYIVDYISNLNNIIFSFPSPIINKLNPNRKVIIPSKIKIPKKRGFLKN